MKFEILNFTKKQQADVCKIKMCSWLFRVEMVLLEVCITNDEDGPLIKMQSRNISLVFHRKSGSEQQTKMDNPRLINRCPNTIYVKTIDVRTPYI